MNNADDLRLYDITCPHCDRAMIVHQQGVGRRYATLDDWQDNADDPYLGDHLECVEGCRRVFRFTWLQSGWGFDLTEVRDADAG